MSDAVSDDAAVPVAFGASVPEQLDRLIRNIGFLAGSQGVTWSLALVYAVFVPRVLGPAGMGVLVLAWSVSGIAVGVAGLGSRPLLVKEVASDPTRAPRLLASAIVARSLLMLPVALLAALYAHLAGFTGARATSVLLALGLALFTLVVDSVQGVLQGNQRMGYLAAADVINKGIATFVSIPLVLLGFGPLWLVALNVAVMAVLVPMNFWWARTIEIDWGIGLGEVWAFVRMSAAYWVFAVFFTIYLWVDSAILAAMATPAEVGWYGVPMKLFQTLMFLPSILSTAWLPRLAVAYRQGPTELREAARVPLQLAAILGLPIGVGTAIIAKPVILLLYGPAYAPAIPALIFLALTAIPMYVNIMVAQILVASDAQSTWTKVMVLASVVNPILNIGLISLFRSIEHNGATGAALSLLITELLIAAIGLVVIRRFVDHRIVARLGRALLVTGAMALVAVLSAPLGLVPEVAAAAVTFCSLALALRVVTSSELAELDRFAARFPGWTRVRGMVRA
jgi:O-antigen/teichoic acid export membrane protein